MKRIFLIIAFVLAFMSSSVAQEIDLGNYDMYITYLKGEYRKTKIPELIIGSPYLDENFRLGSLSFKGKEPITAPTRYNILNEEFEVKIDDKIFYLQEGVEVRLEEGIFKKYNYKSDSNGMLSGYFKTFTREPDDNKLILLEKFTKKIKEAREAAAMKPRTPAKYLDRSDFYLKFPESHFAVLAEGKTKKFVEVFPVEQQEKMKVFITDNKLKTDKQQDLLMIINYYNNIQK